MSKRTEGTRKPEVPRETFSVNEIYHDGAKWLFCSRSRIVSFRYTKGIQNPSAYAQARDLCVQPTKYQPSMSNDFGQILSRKSTLADLDCPQFRVKCELSRNLKGSKKR